jgi:hypothetical protein
MRIQFAACIEQPTVGSGDLSTHVDDLSFGAQRTGFGRNRTDVIDLGSTVVYPVPAGSME